MRTKGQLFFLDDYFCFGHLCSFSMPIYVFQLVCVGYKIESVPERFYLLLAHMWITIHIYPCGMFGSQKKVEGKIVKGKN